MKYYIKTWGCQMNVHDSERISGVLKGEGYHLAGSPDDADLIVFNTCSIRQKAEQKFYSESGKMKKCLKKKRTPVRIAVAGCIAQQEGEKIREHFPHVDLLFGPQNISRLGDMLASDSVVVATDENENLAYSDIPADRRDGVRALVNIMFGCNNFCSYCVVPHTRGRERSRPLDHIIAEITDLALNGYREVTLLGQNVNSYRGEYSFPQLLRSINAIEGIERIRFITSHPKDFSEDLIEAMSGLEKVCEHIHLPLQSGSSQILKAMNRRYTYDDYRKKIETLRRHIPHISITSDIIAGFPGETDRDHRDTMEALKEIEFDGVFAFKYSKRPFTRAARMENQIDEHIKSERLAHILETQDDITLSRNRLLEGKTLDTLVEGKSEKNPDFWTGRTRTNKVVIFSPLKGIEKGAVKSVTIQRGFKHSLEGRLISK